MKPTTPRVSRGVFVTATFGFIDGFVNCVLNNDSSSGSKGLQSGRAMACISAGQE